MRSLDIHAQHAQAPMANGYQQGGRVVKQTSHTTNGPLGGEPPLEHGARNGEWGGAVRSGEAMRTAEQVSSHKTCIMKHCRSLQSCVRQIFLLVLARHDEPGLAVCRALSWPFA